MKHNYLAGKIRQIGMTEKELAPKIGLSPSSVSRRMTGAVPWRTHEIALISKILEISDTEIPLYFPGLIISSLA